MVKSGSKEPIIGIDLGTTNSEVAVLEGGKPIVIASAEGNRYYPSVVAFTKDGEKLVGESAKRQAVTNPEGTVREVKRQMGTDKKIRLNDRDFTPQEVSAMILQKIKQDAETFLGRPVNKAVITVPAYFNDNQRTATKDAGKIAGLDVVRIINEPTAAALAYGLDKSGDHKLGVIDLGGGTFDVTIMDMGDGVFEVISTAGDTRLGGSDMDHILMDHIVKEFKKKQGIDISNDKQAMQRIHDGAENAKMELTSTVSTTINLPFLTADSNGPKHLEMKLTRAQLEDLIEPVLKRLEAPMKQALGDAKMTAKDIDHVILVGGPTRMPCVRERIKKFFNKEPERGVDPMECVAIGASIQAGVLAGDIKDIVLLDVTPLTLGVETLGGVFTPLIERNTTIPTRKGQIFSTAADNQSQVEIHVLQGERKMAADDTTLGRFHLIGIPPAPRGIPQVEVTFDIDANGIINVSAKDLGTGNEQRITITASTKLSDAQINRMMDDAKTHDDEDKKRRDEAEVRNSGDQLLYTTDKFLKEHGTKFPDALRKKLEDGTAELRKALSGGKVDEIKGATEKLEPIMHEAATIMYQQAGAKYQQEHAPSGSQPGRDEGEDMGGRGAGRGGGSGGSGGGGGGGGGGGRDGDKGEKVVDAEYEVVDDKKDDDKDRKKRK